MIERIRHTHRTRTQAMAGGAVRSWGHGDGNTIGTPTQCTLRETACGSAHPPVALNHNLTLRDMSDFWLTDAKPHELVDRTHSDHIG